MKKTLFIAPAIAVLLFTTACGHNNSTSKDSTSSKARTTQTTKKHHKKKTSKKAAGASAASSASSSSPTSTTDRLTGLNRQLRGQLGSPKLPSYYPGNPQSLNAGYAGNSANYTVYYDAGATAGALNAATSANADIAIRKTTMSSAAAAQAQVNYQAMQRGLPTVNLGNGITATEEGAAGSTYYTWAEGRWSVNLRATNVTGENGRSAASQAVTMLHTQSLPVPDAHGAVQLYAGTQGSRANSVTWSEGAAVYTVTGTNFLTTLEVATHLQ